MTSQDGNVATTERLPAAGSEVNVAVCADCGHVEGTRPQAGCCPKCGSTTGNIAWAVAKIER